MNWLVVQKFDQEAVAIVDGKGPFGNGIPHYSRRKPGAPQFMPPGQTLILRLEDNSAVWGWWRPHPRSGIHAMNGLDGWTCTMFRNDLHGDRPTERGHLSSHLILAAETVLKTQIGECGPDGMLTYVFAARVQSNNPGFCYKQAGWRRKGLSADGRKILFSKPFQDAGIVIK